MRYRTLVADPPWHYRDWPGLSTSEKTHYRASGEAVLGVRRPIGYPTMTVDEIAALPVGDLAEGDAHLYLWTTNRYLRDSFMVLDAWGFRYSQTLVWAKTPMGIGPGGAFSQNVEYVVCGRRGRLANLRRFDSCWFNWPRAGKAHSKKPEAFLDLVEQASPGPYLELFARRNRLGWDTWGNESLEHVEIGATS